MAGSVWLLVHADGMYEDYESYVRGVYATEAAARAALVTRTPSGRRSTAYGAHDEHCCDVDEHEVLDAASPDIRDDPPPPDPNAPRLIPPSFESALRRSFTTPSLFDRLGRR